MPSRRSARLGLALVTLAAAGSDGCAVSSGGLRTDRPQEGHAWIAPCEGASYVPHSSGACRLSGQPARAREGVAVVATCSHNYRQPTSFTWLALADLDGRREVDCEAAVQPEGPSWEAGSYSLLDDRECVSLALPPGPHVATLLATAAQEPLRPVEVPGAARFTAEAGRSYAFLVCQPASGPPVFWVRDEETQACVSTACPAGAPRTPRRRPVASGAR